MHAFADSAGSLYMLYRSAVDGRDIYLLTAKEKGTRFQGALVHEWKVPT